MNNMEYNKFLVSSFTHVMVYNYAINIDNIFDILAYVSSLMLVVDDRYKIYIYSMLLLISRLSEFNIVHLLSCLSVIYVSLGYREYINKEVIQLYRTITKDLNLNLKIMFYKKKVKKKKPIQIGRFMKLYNNITYGLNYLDVRKYIPKTIWSMKNIKIIKKYTDNNFLKSDIFRLSQEEFIEEISVKSDNDGPTGNNVTDSLIIIDNYVKK